MGLNTQVTARSEIDPKRTFTEVPNGISVEALAAKAKPQYLDRSS